MKRQKAEGGRRKSSRRRGITTTVITPKWMRDLRAGVRGLKKNAWNLLAGIGLFWVLVQIVKLLAVSHGGG